MKPIIINNRFRLEKKIGSGGFGQVYSGTDLHTRHQVAIKLTADAQDFASLQTESDVFRDLQRGLGFPKLLWVGQQDDHMVLVTELLGPSLEDLFQFCACRFSLKTVLLIADQAIRRLEYMHKRGHVHVDIKPENMVLGTGKEGHLLYLIDFGMTRPLVTDREEAQVVPLGGTVEFASLNSLRLLEPARRDDLESLGYTLLYFLRGTLPWWHIKGDTDEQTKALMTIYKRDLSLEELCDRLPDQFLQYMLYVRRLRFSEKPNYRYLRQLFSKLFHERGYKNDNVFHWTQWRYHELRGESIPALGF